MKETNVAIKLIAYANRLKRIGLYEINLAKVNFSKLPSASMIP